MQSFIVLGIIPGTNFQTTFNFWLTMAALFIVFMGRRHITVLRYYTQIQIAAYRIAREIGAYEFQSI